MGALYGPARAAAGSDQGLRIKVEEAHLRSGSPTADELLADGASLHRAYRSVASFGSPLVSQDNT